MLFFQNFIYLFSIYFQKTLTLTLANLIFGPKVNVPNSVTYIWMVCGLSMDLRVDTIKTYVFIKISYVDAHDLLMSILGR